jgi:hypothetical protein
MPNLAAAEEVPELGPGVRALALSVPRSSQAGVACEKVKYPTAGFAGRRSGLYLPGLMWLVRGQV